VAIALGLPGIIIAVASYVWYIRPYSPPTGTDIFTAVQGRWAWTTADSGCATKWHTIAFTSDRKVMTITSSKPYQGADGKLDSVAVYDIQAHDRGWIRGAIRGEQRLTADGHPVVWDLVLRSSDRYAWHRTDWFRGGYTAEIERCSNPGLRPVNSRPPNKRLKLAARVD